MSDLRIGLVAEGVTDDIVIEAALKAILPKPFILILLQPEETRPQFGGGWCGVLKWCAEQRDAGYLRLEDDPTLASFDLVVLHVDADVADMSYADCGARIESRVPDPGEHAILLAPTAGGNTEAAVFPVLSRMLAEGWSGLSVLYVCPIKALLNNLDPRVSHICGLVAALWHGDVGPSEKARLASNPPDLPLTTPESLEVMLISRGPALSRGRAAAPCRD